MSSLDERVAVITRTKNRPLLLPRAAESVLSQRADNLVWVVVNDGGAVDPVEVVVDDFRNKSDHEVVVIHNEESVGMEAASNLGIASSESEYIVIHDDDDTWEAGFLSTCLRFLHEKTHYRGVITRTNSVQEQVRGAAINRLSRKPFNSHLESVDLAHISIRNQFPPISFLFSRAVYDDIGGFDENMPVLGDWDFNLRFLLKADIGFLPEYLANHHTRVASPDGQSSYENTVVEGLQTHVAYESRYRHAKFREDLASGQAGLGHLLVTAKQFQLLANDLERLRIAGDGWRKIYSAVRKLGFR